MTVCIRPTNIRTKLVSEVDGVTSGLHGFYKSIPSFRSLPLSPTPMKVALDEARLFMSMMNTYKESGSGGFGELPPCPAGVNLEEYAAKIMTADPTSLAAEFSAYDIEYPCVYVISGSACPALIVS